MSSLSPASPILLSICSITICQSSNFEWAIKSCQVIFILKACFCNSSCIRSTVNFFEHFSLSSLLLTNAESLISDSFTKFYFNKSFLKPPQHIKNRSKIRKSLSRLCSHHKFAFKAQKKAWPTTLRFLIAFSKRNSARGE